MPKTQHAIFFSYAWGGEKEKYALDLYQSLHQAGYKVVMDRQDVPYRASFAKFMKRMGRGAFVVVVVSDKYLRSPYCMFELLEIYRKSNSELEEMALKVYPVVMGDAGIYEDAAILQYIQYWRQKTNELGKGMVTDMDLVDAADMAGNLKKYNEIANQFASFANWLRDTNTLSPEKIADNDFAVIKTAIAEQIVKAADAPNEGASNDIHNSGAQIGQQNINSHVYVQYGEKKVRKYLGSPFFPEILMGRELDLKAIYKKLFTENNLLLLVNGEGGIGKTSLAARYYLNHQDDYRHLAWVVAEKSLLEALLTLQVPLQMKFPEEADGDARLLLLLEELKSLGRPCLLVIDNANNLDELDSYYLQLRTCPNFHILFTTRVTTFRQATTYAIQALQPNVALGLFVQYYPGHKRAEDALFEKLYQAVGGNTLVLELMAKNLACLNALEPQYSLRNLLADLQSRGLLALTYTETVSTDYHAKYRFRTESPETIIAAMYDLGELTAAEKRLLGIMALLPAENIPFAALKALLPQTLALDKSLLLLAQKGWLEHNQTDIAFKISPVVQEIVRNKNEALLTDAEELMDGLIDKLEHDGYHITGSSYAQAAQYAHYAVAVVNNSSAIDNSRRLVCERLGSFYQITGNLPNALRFYALYVALSKELVDAFPDNMGFKNGLAIAYEKMGETHAAMGKLPTALQFYELDAALTKELVDAFPDNMGFKNGLAVAYEKMGQTHAAMGKLPTALQFYEERSRIGKELFDAFPDNVGFKNGLAIAYSKMGETHAAMGKLPTALQFYELDAALTKELVDAFPDNVGFKNGLAIAYAKLGDFYKGTDTAKARHYFAAAETLWAQLVAMAPEYAQFKQYWEMVKERLEGL